jgi:hypothetical protein
MNNTFDKPNATYKFSRLFPGVDFVKASFLDIMIDISNAMADIEHPVYVIIGRTMSFGGTSLSYLEHQDKETVLIWRYDNSIALQSMLKQEMTSYNVKMTDMG